MANSYHIFNGDGNEGTFYNETVRNCPADLIDTYVLDAYIREDFQDQTVTDGDDQQGCIYIPDEGAFGASSVVIDYYLADADDDCIRCMPSRLQENVLEDSDIERLRSIAK